MKKLLPLLILTLFLAFASAGAVVQDGAKHTLIYAGNRYEGIITEGTKEKGSGVFFDQTGTYWKWVKGTRYEGEFVSMKLHGQGTMTSPDGRKYVGEYKGGYENGQGTGTSPDGRKYVGEYKDGSANGQGTETTPDGSKYVGDWKDGMKNGHGKGIYISRPRRLYVGEWKDGKANGQGILTFAFGQKYVGEFKDGIPHGQGTQTTPDGSKYVGEWKNGKKNGQGTETTPDGDKYVGEWKDGKRVYCSNSENFFELVKNEKKYVWIDDAHPCLIEAARTLTQEDVLVALADGADVNVYSGSGYSPLMFAVTFNGDPNVIKALLDAGANHQARAVNLWPPLMWAMHGTKFNSILDQSAIIKLLLDAGAEVGNEALIKATRKFADPNIVQVLLDAGADPDILNRDNETPLMIAIMRNTIAYQNSQNHKLNNIENLDVIQALLDGGADVNAGKKGYKTALSVAVTNNPHPKLIQALLDAGADVNAGSPLASLLSMEPRVEFTNSSSFSLVGKPENHRLKLFQMLMDAGADVNIPIRIINHRGRTPLMGAKNIKMFQIMLDAGADVNAGDVNGNTALHLAIGSDEMVIALLEAGADVSAKNKSGKTAWDLINENRALRKTEAYKRLSERKPNTYIPSLFLSNLMPEDVRLAVSSGADLEERNRYGWTPLLAAIEDNQRAEVIKAFLDAGANMNAGDIYGSPPLVIAVLRANHEVVMALLDAGAVQSDINAAWEEIKGNSALSGTKAYERLKELRVKPDITKVNSTEEDLRGFAGEYELRKRAKIGCPNRQKNIFGWVPGNWGFLQRVRQAQRLTPECARAAIAEGVDLEVRSNEGQTVLMYVTSYTENPEVVQVLLDAGANLEARTTKYGNQDEELSDTPLMYAARYNNNAEVMKVLLDTGADVKARHGTGFTALMYAAYGTENPEVVQLLLDAGSDLEVRNDKENLRALDWTPLLIAARFNENGEVVLVLLEAGADASAKNSIGKTAWDLIQKNEQLINTHAYLRLKDLQAN